MIKKTLSLRVLLASMLALPVLLFPALAQAAVYGGGTYDSCKYSQGCSSSSGGASTSGQTSPSGNQAEVSAGAQIILNNFDEYFKQDGKHLELTKDQVIFFDVTENGVLERHSVTVKEVGADYVILIVSSDPITARLSMGQTESFDVSGDKQNDIAITLTSIKDTKAFITFQALSAAAKTPSKESIEQSSEKDRNYTWIIISVTAIVLAITIRVVLFVNKRRQIKSGPQ